MPCSPHSAEAEEILRSLSSDKDGLSAQTAAQRLLEFGKNEIEEGKKKSFLIILLEQLKNLMLIILLVAAFVSMLLGEVSDFVIIFAVVILNALMGAIQESRAASALDALKKMSAPSANVIRDAKAVTVKASELVPGDIVMLAAGDSVPADLRLISSALLKIDEAMLTGESHPVDKDAHVVLPEDTPLAERINMAYSGTNVTYGRGLGVVCNTGLNTVIGQIAQELKTAKDSETPLQKRLNGLSKILTYSVLTVAAVVFTIGALSSRHYIEMFLVAVSLAVAAIPEGLATVVTLQMTMGVQKMSKRGAIVRRLPAVETLGCTSVICSDKTGTLTQNRMSVLKAYYNGAEYDARELPRCEELSLIDKVFLLCNDTKVAIENGKTEYIGDPTETALFAFAEQRLDVDLREEHERVLEIPFDSERKLMSTVNGKDSFVLYVKGAPDSLLERCTKISSGGRIEELTPEIRRRINAANENFARQALRVIGAAYKPLKDMPESIEGLECGLIFLGLAGMMDPPRAEAKDAVRICRDAGILPIMITGDHKTTAEAVASELDILQQGNLALTGRELDGLSDEDLLRDLYDIRVYARVAPSHKVRIVKAFKSKGEVVAMTGDGVNDASALKAADIGVGMGITGTEVSKGASDMVLTDDNFATIVKAVEEGRRIFRNIKKVIQFLLSTNLSEVLTLFIGTMLGVMVLYPVQILWINLVTDTFPALALGMEPAPENIMKRKPRSASESFLSGIAGNIIANGAVMGALTLGVYFLALSNYGDPVAATSMAFMTLGLIQLFHSFNVRSAHRSAANGLLRNKWMFVSLLLSAFLQVIVVLAEPINGFFNVTALSGEQWLFSTAAAFAVIPVNEAIKLIKRIIRK